MLSQHAKFNAIDALSKLLGFGATIELDGVVVPVAQARRSGALGLVVTATDHLVAGASRSCTAM
jgi:hypothetical protein